VLSGHSCDAIAREQIQQSADVFPIFSKKEPEPQKPIKVALIGNFAPRKCGIATFTTDVFEQLREHRPDIRTEVYALDDPAAGLSYENVRGTIIWNDRGSFADAARQINESIPDVIWLQHEYGIYGGDCGELVCGFVDRLTAPLVLTLHTVLTRPSAKQRAILEHLISRASRIMVMSRHSRDLLIKNYGCPKEILEVIEHGAPDRPLGRQAEFRALLGHSNRKIMMTFGLLGPGKGIERVIEALPAIVERHPSILYRIVGATHPNMVAREGEAYRQKLAWLAESLKVSAHVEWDNRFLETDELLDQLEASDIYVTPYSNLQQSTSGTLSYAVALGKAVVSTPYVHARELLHDGVGVLIQPGSAEEIAGAVIDLLDDPARLNAIQRRAYAKGRETIWPRFAQAAARLVKAAAAPATPQAPLTKAPGLDAIFAMSDGTGILQHAIGVVPDRRHGYCLDDNARALMLLNVASGLTDMERQRWGVRYASFIQDAWNGEVGRFRNFMRFDRSWCEDSGSDDSNGRALWALGRTVEASLDPELRRWALRWYDATLPSLANLGSPRSVAFVMLGACAVLRVMPGHDASRGFVTGGAGFLMRLLDNVRRPDWIWFETVLGYDNPRLSQALIEAAEVCGEHIFLEAGIETLDWIAQQQAAARGHFRPIGSESFGRPYDYMPFDQQPLEAQAAIEAASAAFRVIREPKWIEHALSAWRWFFGGNDRGVALADLASGRCRDGLTPRGANENCGAESILAFQLSHYSMLAMVSKRHGDVGDEFETGSKSAG
jgi:glycosyltransferase involved in cell wall biosynthesis